MRAIHFTVVMAGLCLGAFNLRSQTDTLTNGLVAYYPLTSNANDESGHDNNGQLQSATGIIDETTNAFTKVGLSCDGTHRVVVRDARSLDPAKAISLSAWFKADNWNGNGRILQKGDMQYQFCAEYGFFNFRVSQNVQNNSLHAALPSTGAWHHAVGTYDGTSIIIYMDNDLVAKQSARGRIATSNPSRNPNIFLNLGGKPASTDLMDFFRGLISDVRIYNRALSSSEVSALYAAELRAHQ